MTRSRAVERAAAPRYGTRAWRSAEAVWMLAISAMLAAGLALVYRAKTNAFAQVEQGLQTGSIVNLNELGSREQLLPYLTVFPEQAERQFAARQIYYSSGGLRNVGAIARLRVTADQARRTRGLSSLVKRMGPADSIPLLTGEQFRLLKPAFVVRRPGQFTRAFATWTAVFFAALWLVHVYWSVRGVRGDLTLLPAAMLLSGVGYILMLSLRDPVRDTMLFTDFAQGVAGGGLLLAALSAVDWERAAGRLSFVPLAGSFVLSVLLIVFGSGPGTSDAKVNLFGFQPVEVIRLLLVLFLAGYFARRWDVLRHVRETRPALAKWGMPPVEYTFPVFASVALSLVFFFLQKDLGPALVFACLFLALYGVARAGVLVPLAGFALMAAGFAFGYWIGFPRTVSERVAMWLSPWDNLARGGDQLAHSLWAFATGGLTGSGPGRGEPQVVPAAHTDLVLSALGEEWGCLGLLAVFAVYAFVVYRAGRIALRARTDYEFFLAAGLTASLAVQTLFIAGGALGVFPLSGIVTPFLSYGRSAMLANFALLAMLMAVSRNPGTQERNAPFAAPVKWAGIVFGGLAAAIALKAAYVQVARDAAVMGRGTLVVQADGARRFQYNPRFLDLMREIPKGAIYDRNGLPLATSSWEELEKHRAEYAALGIDLARCCRKTDARHYPLGGLMFDLVGDLRTRARWGAPNSSFVERDSATRLRGYDDRPTLVEVKNPTTGNMDRVVRYDYRELLPLLRHRYEPNHPAVRRVLDRPRDVRMSIDARLQLRAAQILERQLRAAGREKGAIVIMDPATGDLLASASLPAPATEEQQAAALDRARYGLYPPGSTFKMVTAMAALRKNPQSWRNTHTCVRLPDGRVGAFLKGSSRPIRDDVMDAAPHGAIAMERGLIVSCNAYFAQLGTYDVGAQALFDTGSLLGITMGTPNTARQLGKALAQSAYGQGQVVASPFQMARAAAVVANGGMMPFGRWVTDESNDRTREPVPVLTPENAALLGRFLREAVTSGTGRRAAGAIVPIAGKTGTAELANAPSHAWFAGFAPYGGERKIAFAILVENGQYGGTNAAPAAVDLVAAAREAGLL
ncbi:MAG: FtsW/RodA/SpoVE family cell cycle protein [Bryobacteraceae bacterium]